MKLTIRKQFGSPYKQNPTQNTLPIFLLLASTPWYARLARQPEWQAAMKSTHKAIVIHMVSAQTS